MKVSKHLKVENRCVDCNLRDSSYFCDFSTETLQRFELITRRNNYPKGACLFAEGQPSDGIFLVCRGRVKLTTHSRNGKALILRIGEPGEIIGLSSSISDSPSETTAQALEPCEISFVEKSDFVRFIKNNSDAGINALLQMGVKYRKAYKQIRSLGLSACVADRLAALLLEWAKDSPSTGRSVRLKIAFSHEEIAEMIGTSRETVTRLLKDFRERGLILIKGTDLHIPDKPKLEATIGNGKGPKSRV